MMQTYLKINEDGGIARVTVEEIPGSMNEDVFKSLSAKATRRVDNICRLNGEPVGFLISGNECWCWSQLKTLPMHSHFQFTKDKKILTPKFVKLNETNDRTYPVFRCQWTPPADMQIIFAAKILGYETRTPKTHYQQSCFLLTYDGEGRCWKLPLPNIYNDLAICMGDFRGQSDSAVGAFSLALDQFGKSDWNSDLIEGQDTASAQLFRFTPTEEGINSLAVEPKWQQYCKKIATPISMMMSQVLKPGKPAPE